ncbi:interferon a3-like [Dicentrarchus labrax]|uniref:Interferon n=1 Tax=Dicentrarchus labrax TaxID=13489 RepID=A0A8P4K806_DICLA|nr:interferon a3-like [Dicentrarchus labrax]
MLNRIFFVCLSLSLYSAGSSLSCRWIMDHKFRQHSENSLALLDTMANNSTNTTEDAEVEDTVAFPNLLYRQASKASAEDQLAFTVQILNETAALFEEDHSSASWEENTVEDFVNVVTQQADNLRSCIGSHGHKKTNKKLQMYFMKLSSHVLKKMGHSAEAWELIRTEIKTHLMRADQLVSSLLTTN